MVGQTHECAWTKQLEHLGLLPAMESAWYGLDLRCGLERTGGSRKCHREADGREGHHCPVVVIKASISLEFFPFLALNP